MDGKELQDVYNAVATARFPEDVFGELGGSNVTEIEASLNKKYRAMAKVSHPDLYNLNPALKYLAEEATKNLNQYLTEAKKLISVGIYGSRSNPGNYSNATTKNGSTFSSFRSGGCVYNIYDECVEGDFCSVYFGEMAKNGISENICLKIPNSKDDNFLMDNEYDILNRIKHKHMPVILGNFMDKNGKKANVIRRVEGGHDLNSVREKFPDGLPQEHGVWVMDRLLSVLGYLHINNIIHGSIEPGNVIIVPQNHNAVLIDYLMAIPEANIDSSEYVGFNDYTAPEVKNKANPHPAADMYSLGKTMNYLLGGKDSDMPDNLDCRIEKFLSCFLKEDPDERKCDAWKSYHELSELRKEVFGSQHQFLELKI